MCRLLAFFALCCCLFPNLAAAEPGDPLAMYVVDGGEPVALNTTEKGKLGDAAVAIWPTVVKANLTALDCHRPKGGPTAHCSAGEETVPTDIELLRMVVAGQVSGAQDKPWVADVVPLSVLAAFALDAFGDIISTLYQIKAWRDPDAPALVWAKCWRIKIETPEQWRADRDAGLVVLTLAELIEE